MIGYLACILVTIAYLPQLWETIKTGVCGVSNMTLMILLVGMFLWCLHANETKDAALLCSSTLSFFQIAVLSYYKIKQME